MRDLQSVVSKYCHSVLVLRCYTALLVILWNFNMFFYAGFLEIYIADIFKEWDTNHPEILHFILSIHYIAIPLYPLVGVIADVWTGRYRVIVVSIYCCFIGWLITAVSYFTVDLHIVPTIALILGICFQLIGMAGFTSTILPFLVDQTIAVGASTDELTSLLYWYGTGYPFSLWIRSVLKCSIHNWDVTGGVCLVVSGTSIVIVMSSYYILRQVLDTTPQISNPFKLIFQVLNYSRRTKYPENRSALTYYLDEAPSRLDIGKNKYGGPFKEEQVEDVKTVLRILPLFVCLFGTTQAIEVLDYTKFMSNAKSFLQCTIVTKGFYHFPLFLYGLSFIIIILPCFNKYIPSMLKRIQIGLGICLLSVLMYLAIDVAASLKGTDNSCWLNTTQHHNATAGIHYHWVLLPEMFSGVGFGTTAWVAIEFTLAQSPGYMRGLMIGIWYCVLGLGALCSFLLYMPFGYINSSSLPVNCTVFYHSAKSVLVFVIALLFYILAKRYKLRVREEVLNIHHIVTEHYSRYLENSNSSS